MMLVKEQYKIFFCEEGILSKPQESSMNEDHDPFKEMVSDDGE